MRCVIEPASRFLAFIAQCGSLSSLTLDVYGTQLNPHYMDPTSKQVIKMVLEAVQHLASSLQSSELELALEMADNLLGQMLAADNSLQLLAKQTTQLHFMTHPKGRDIWCASGIRIQRIFHVCWLPRS